MKFAVSNSNRSNAERGSVITECVLVIPLLLIIFTGLTELGRTFAQINWVANISYEVALIGGAVPEASGGSLAMDGRYSQLRSIPYYTINLPTTPTSVLYDQAARTVAVEIHATLPTLLSYISPTFDVHAVAPILVLGSGQPGNLSTFHNAEINGVTVYYDCCGDNPSPTPPSSSCIPMPTC